MEQLNPMAIGATNTSPNLQAIRLKQEQKNAPKQFNPTDVNINVTDFDTSGFPDYIRRFILDTSAFNNVDENSVSFAVLQTIALSMGANNFFDVIAPDGNFLFHNESLNLFTLLVARSGTGKTPLFKTLLNEINVFNKELLRDYKQKRKEWEKDHTAPEPNDYGVLINNLTVEGLLKQITDNCNENAEMQLPVLMATDEASGFLSKMSDLGKFHDAKSFFCNAWDGQSFSSSRKSEKIYVDRILFHFLGATQVSSFDKILQENPDFIGQGLLYRFIVYQDRTSSLQSPLGVRRDKRSEESFHYLICEKLRSTKKVYNFTDEATTSFNTYCNNVLNYVNTQFHDEETTSMLMKIRLLTARIAVVFAGSNKHNNVENDDVLHAINVANFIIHNNNELIKKYRKTVQQLNDPSLSNCSTSELYDAFLNRCVTPEKRSQLTPTDVARFIGRADNYFRR